MDDHSSVSSVRFEMAKPTELRLKTARAWQHANTVKRVSFAKGADLFADPAWEILVDLYIQAAHGRPVSVSSACLASGVPPTTGLRWLNRLCQEGLVERNGDANDARRIQVTLTHEAVARIETALDRAVESDRRMGLGRLDFVAA